MIGYRSVPLLSRAIASLLRHTPSSISAELVLVQNGDHEAVSEFAEALLESEKLPLALVRVPECRPGAARNAGVRCGRAGLLLFLDDDVECFQDIIGAALAIFSDPAVQAAGGANLTPPGSPALARATGLVMGTRFGAASMRSRYMIGPESSSAGEHDLILCNLALRRAAFERERGFARHLISNEENVLLQRLEAQGAKLCSSPGLAVYHARRESFSGIAAQAAKYGAGRAQNLLAVPDSFRVLYFLPLLFLAYLAFLPLLAWLLGPLVLLPLGLYVALALTHGFAEALGRADAGLLLAPLVFPLVHLAYGWGFLRAMFLWFGRRRLLQEHGA